LGATKEKKRCRKRHKTRCKMGPKKGETKDAILDVKNDA
jgi:hypothetical protein